MQKASLVAIAIFFTQYVAAQHTFKTIIKDKTSGSSIAEVNVEILHVGTTQTDPNGYAQILNVPDGKQIIIWSHAGYQKVIDTIYLPISFSDTKIIELEKLEEQLDVVVLQSTRIGRSIANTPTRVETIDGEELDEKNNMRPANVSMLLHESTGIQVQQTSATSGNASIRVQGLDGRYTQLLKDSYAGFGNFANGLSILEIPSLDLKQVEVIKGPASTLYGGGAIAGVVNFISKMPEEKFEGDVLLNQSNIGQTNLGGYFSQRRKKIGYAVLGLLNRQSAYDVDKDDFSELPKSTSFTVNPRLFFYPSNSITISLGNSLSSGESVGGDMHAIKDEKEDHHKYFEKNNTFRNTTTFEFDKRFLNNRRFTIKQSVAFFNRTIKIPNYIFSGKNINTFSDISYLVFAKEHTIISGANFVYDGFRQQFTDTYDNKSYTTGIYFQDTWDVSKIIKLESGFRADFATYNNINFKKNQNFLLPRISALFKFSPNLTSRLGGGLGYKLPTIFTELTESMQYQNIQALDNVKAEKSVGATADINYKARIGDEFSISFNQMFFLTRINQPLVLGQTEEGSFMFTNASKPIVSRGFETNLKLIFLEDLKLFAGYTFTNARAKYLTENQILPLMPRHKLNAVIMYEKEDNFKLGLEGYHTGTQFLNNGYKTPAFWEFGFMAQKTFNKISLFINFENFTDERQSRYKSVVNPPFDNPTFDDIWNHTEGRTINGGVKIKL